MHASYGHIHNLARTSDDVRNFLLHLIAVWLFIRNATALQFTCLLRLIGVLSRHFCRRIGIQIIFTGHLHSWCLFCAPLALPMLGLEAVGMVLIVCFTATQNIHEIGLGVILNFFTIYLLPSIFLPASVLKFSGEVFLIIV